MAGTGTYPDITVATPNALYFTIHLIDASGDNETQAFVLDPATTDANLKALADTYQAATQASIYKLTKSFVFEGDEDADNAEALFRGSVKDGINLLWRDAANNDTISPRLMAPIPDVMQGNQDIPLLTGTALEFLAVAISNVLPVGYEFNQMQFTERKERKNNPVVKI